MPNEYFSFSNALSRFSLARSDAINSIFTLIETAFDRLPSRTIMDRNMLGIVTGAGAANTYTGSMVTPLTALAVGVRISLIVPTTNTGASTLDMDGLGARPLRLLDGSEVAAGDLAAGDVTDFTYNGTFWALSGVPRSVASGFSEPDTVNDASFYVSGEISLIKGGLTTMAHGFATRPKIITGYLRCKSSDLGYSIGDEVRVSLVYNDNYLRHSLYADETNIYFRFTTTVSNHGFFELGNAEGTPHSVIAASQWRLVIVGVK